MDRKRGEGPCKRQARFLLEFPTGRVGHVLAGIDRPARHLPLHQREVRFVKNQKPVAPGRIDEHLQRIRLHR